MASTTLIWSHLYIQIYITVELIIHFCNPYITIFYVDVQWK